MTIKLQTLWNFQSYFCYQIWPIMQSLHSLDIYSSVDNVLDRFGTSVFEFRELVVQLCTPVLQLVLHIVLRQVK
jgi:hypothetical protein